MPDTKFDLVESPLDFLGRALHLWDAEGAFGQLQNQAYGYLWPMGPFFALGWLAHLPGWLVQRLWLALVMVTAFAGCVKVARALGVRSDLAALTAGFAFALSPRMLTTLGPISIEAWPSAMAPWVLLALVHGSRGGSPRRWGALAALAVAMVGGVNAAATFAVIPLGVVWLLTRTPGPRRRALMLWWPVFTLLATLWWLVPLFVMGSYSPPFLDYIETTSVTTFPTTLFDVLRGTSDWVPYIDRSSRAGNDLITTSYLALNSGVVLLVGIAGLLNRRTPERVFLVLAVLVGALMVSAGHAGAVEGWFAEDLRALLDGPLAPLRNVHKFDVVVRLPLVLGLGLVLDGAMARPRDSAATGGVAAYSRGNQVTVLTMILLAVAGSMVPAFVARITPAGATLEVPRYWHQTADWLAAHRDGTALLVPGAPFGDYLWGAPKDEPLQYLSSAPWAVRNVIPLTPPGNIRMLDEVEDRLAQGHGSPGFAAYLRRAGVRYVVVRNDLQPGSDVPLPVLVHQALRQSGLSLVAQFGPEVGGGATLPARDGSRVVVNSGWQDAYAAVEVYEVPGDTGRAVTSTAPPVVVGGPEDLVDLLDFGMLRDGPVQLAADAGVAAPEGPVLLTDGLRRRERFFARIHDGYSPTLTPGEPRRSGNPARDYLIDQGDRWATRARLDGVATVAASSSQSDADAFGGTQRGEQPYAAVDGSRLTEWVSAAGRNDAWWQVDLDDPLSPTSVAITGGASASENQEVRVLTESGTSETVELGPGQTRRVPLSGAATQWLRVEDASGTAGRRLAIAEVATPGLVAHRRLVTPVLPQGWAPPDAIALRADLDHRTGCVEVDGDVRCAEGRARASEEPLGLDRVVTLPSAASYDSELQVVPRAGPALTRALLRGQAIRVTASSAAVPDPRAGPVAAIDGDLGTTWMASSDDLRPTLSLKWLGDFPISGIAMTLDDATAARAPLNLRLTWRNGSRDVELDNNGRATFPTIRTDSLEIRIDEADFTSDLGFDGRPASLGIGIGELRLVGLPYLPLGLSADRRETGCGVGPSVVVNGTRRETYVAASPAELFRGVPVPAVICDPTSASPRATEVGPLQLRQGENVLTMNSNRAFTAASWLLSLVGGHVVTNAATGAREDGTAVSRRVTPEDQDAAVLELRQNANPGWEATQDGRRLRPVVLDGWKQGWQLDEARPVAVRFAPDRTYRLGLGVGLVALLTLVVGTILMRGRGREDAPPLRARLLPGWLGVMLVVVLGGVVGGWVGVGVAFAGGGAAVFALQRWPDETPWLLAAPCLAAAAGYAIRPWGSASGWAGDWGWTDYAVLISLAGVLAGVLVRSPMLPHPFRRRAGRSTTR